MVDEDRVLLGHDAYYVYDRVYEVLLIVPFVDLGQDHHGEHVYALDWRHESKQDRLHFLVHVFDYHCRAFVLEYVQVLVVADLRQEVPSVVRQDPVKAKAIDVYWITLEIIVIFILIHLFFEETIVNK